MMTIEIQSWKLSIKTVDECHSLCNVNGKLDSSVRVHNKSEMNLNILFSVLKLHEISIFRILGWRSCCAIEMKFNSLKHGHDHNLTNLKSNTSKCSGQIDWIFLSRPFNLRMGNWATGSYNLNKDQQWPLIKSIKPYLS